MADYTGRELIVVRVRGTDMQVAAAELGHRLAAYPNARITALTQRSSGIYDWSSSIQLVAAIEFTA
ncbi:MAG: hypothetical protein ABI305_02360 [Tepidiformaceae bacterium]